ncbi:hypothetical protein FXO37_32883 [Capsicum annuum]|nr:hypothetical protein FXO37_32883 [Capsicum annuum]
MDHNECNNQLRETLHDIFGLENSDSLHGNEDSYGRYVNGPGRYLDTDDEDLQKLANEEMNRELRRTVKRSLVAHDIVGLRPSKSIRLLEVKSGGPERMSVNHQNQSILLGCALLMSEDIKTYAFVFKTWLTAMGEIPPTAILTDQCKNIKAAICEILLKNMIWVDGFGSKVSTRSGPNGFPYISQALLLGWDLKNVLKPFFKIYMAWKDDMVVPNIPDSDSDADSIIIRNLREVYLCGRLQINKNRSSHQYAFYGDARRWGSGYYDVYEEGKRSQGRSGGGRWGRRGSRGGGVCCSRGGRGNDANEFAWQLGKYDLFVKRSSQGSMG